MAHQFVPTYPKLEQSYVPGILKARMELFNSRSDVTFYEIEVFDKDWNPVPFATESKVLQIPHLTKKNIDVHIREQDRNRALYICSKSKLLSQGNQVTMIASKICSKIK